MSFVIGTLITQPFVGKMQHHIGRVFLFLMVIHCLASSALLFVGDDPSDIPIYFLLIFMSSITTAGFNTYTATTDLRSRARDNKMFMIINSVNRIILRTVQTISLAVSGVLI